MKIYNFIKDHLEASGIKFGIGNGVTFRDGKFAYAPYLKVNFFDFGIFDFGAFVNTLGELGMSSGVTISKKKNKAKIIIDTGICTELKDEIRLAKMNFKLHAGFRISF